MESEKEGIGLWLCVRVSSRIGFSVSVQHFSEKSEEVVKEKCESASPPSSKSEKGVSRSPVGFWVVPLCGSFGSDISVVSGVREPGGAAVRSKHRSHSEFGIGSA